MPTESTFLLAGLFLLLAAAGWALGRFGERDEEDAPPPLNVDYLKGLNFLLNEQTDQALEHFLRAAGPNLCGARGILEFSRTCARGARIPLSCWLRIRCSALLGGGRASPGTTTPTS